MKDCYIDHYGIDSLPHLISAYDAGASHFLTTNQSLLDDREELQKTFNIKIVTPNEMMEEQKGDLK